LGGSWQAIDPRPVAARLAGLPFGGKGKEVEMPRLLKGRAGMEVIGPVIPGYLVVAQQP
jgi:hypothetical protein